ncbi:MAG: hypothetical protein LQ352_008140 [Teloschistes flavicans]|nr:MAG: hypothetical protein LQ352_008140 [Teloschistes flavicans]
MAQVFPEEDLAVKSEFSPEVRALARRIYDENRYYVPIASGMVNQDLRITIQTTPEGGLIIYRYDTSLHLGSCNTFAHPPYGSSREYRGEKGRDYYVNLTLAELAGGASECGFCFTLYQGIQNNKTFWINKWSRIKWIDSHPNSNIRETEAMKPWFEEYWPYFQGEKSVSEEEIFLHVTFPKGHPYVDVHMNMAPFHFADAEARRLPIAHLEYYTAPRLEYIWIDSLCIIQKDDLDWENELPRMSNIYGNAAVVFAVHGPDLGFHRAPVLPIRDIGRPDDNPVYCRQKIDHRSIFCAPTDAESWFGRAWCMQERIFARRILHFGGFCEELYFECNTEVSCECSRVNKTSTVTEEEGRTLKAQVTSATALIKDQPESAHIGHQLWRLYVTCCEDYSARGVTFATDTLPAVSALMSSLAPYFGNYYAGLWQSHLLLCLQWEALYTSECSRHEKFVAPSFSWASRSGAVTWYMDLSKMPTKDTHDFAAVVDVACTVKGKDPFGGVSAGYVTLRGPLTEMSIASKDLFGPDDRMKMTKKGAKECYVTLDSREDIQEVYLGMMVTCLDVMRDKNGRFVSSLVLLPLDPLSRKFRRIGFSTMLVEHFDGASQEEITII